MAFTIILEDQPYGPFPQYYGYGVDDNCENGNEQEWQTHGSNQNKVCGWKEVR